MKGSSKNRKKDELGLVHSSYLESFEIMNKSEIQNLKEEYIKNFQAPNREMSALDHRINEELFNLKIE